MSQLTDLADQFRADLLAGDTEAARRLVADYRVVEAVIAARLAALLAEIQQRRDAGQDVTPGWLLQSDRLRILLGEVQAEIDRYATAAGADITQRQADAVRQGQQHAIQLTLAGLGPGPADARRAVAARMTRLPREATETLVGMLGDGTPLSDALARLGPQAAEGVTRALVAGVATGMHPRVIAPMVQRASRSLTLTSALKLSRTAPLNAYRAASLATYRANNDVIESWTWRASLSARTCPVCLALHGSEHPLSERFMKSHWQCIPAGAVVSGPRAIASTERVYIGPIVEIDTVSGNRLTITPNHPILTPQGWIAAGLLNEGDDVISSRFSERPLSQIDPDNDQVPAMIEQVARATGELGAMVPVSVPTSPIDFHGDGFGSQVHVIRANRELSAALDSAIQQPTLQQAFGWGHTQLPLLASPRDAHAMFQRLFLPAHALVGSPGVPSILLGSPLCHRHAISFGLPASLDSGVSQPQRNDIAGDTEALRQRVLGLSGEVGTYDLINWQRLTLFSQLLRDLCRTLLSPFRRLIRERRDRSFAGITDADFGIEQPTFERWWCDVVLLRQMRQRFASLVTLLCSRKPLRQRLGFAVAPRTSRQATAHDLSLQSAEIDVELLDKVRQRLSGEVEIDRIVKVSRRPFAGHVYNLQTHDEWYIANGVIVHNCRCAPLPRTKSWADLGFPGIPDRRPDIGSGSEWFARQDEATQLAVLGPAKLAAYKAGELTLHDLVGTRHDPIWGQQYVERSLKVVVGERDAARFTRLAAPADD